MVYLNAHYCVLWDLWVNKASVSFLQQFWTLKIKIKHRYNYTDSASMG